MLNTDSIAHEGTQLSTIIDILATKLAQEAQRYPCFGSKSGQKAALSIPEQTYTIVPYATELIAPNSQNISFTDSGFSVQAGYESAKVDATISLPPSTTDRTVYMAIFANGSRVDSTINLFAVPVSTRAHTLNYTTSIACAANTTYEIGVYCTSAVTVSQQDMIRSRLMFTAYNTSMH